ncbi:MAG: TetR/AcrR family transcriptional regulator [Myxococcales bacterium]|nr:TetR/AcrR family transcriptional regulator [Myxococcales bacterium]MCB9641784.1 TetR/AcrR family transcriptional regulator [Myxococcales bacterium]
MSKSEETRSSILHQALDISSEVGLEGLSLGILAKRVEMSKSGLYAHFSSKENLQCAVLDTAAERFIDIVLSPALKQPRGIPRLKALFERWLQWEDDEFSGGCLFITAATEFDDRPGPVRDRLVDHLRDVLDAIARAADICKKEGHFRSDLDTEQFRYDFWGVLLSYQHFRRLLQHPQARDYAHRAFERLVSSATPH